MALSDSSIKDDSNSVVGTDDGDLLTRSAHLEKLKAIYQLKYIITKMGMSNCTAIKPLRAK